MGASFTYFGFIFGLGCHNLVWVTIFRLRMARLSSRDMIRNQAFANDSQSQKGRVLDESTLGYSGLR